MMTGDAAAMDLMTSALMKRFTRVTRNWSQNYAVHRGRGSIVPDDLPYMDDKSKEAEVAAHCLLNVLDEEVDLKHAIQQKIDKVRVDYAALILMPSQSDAPDAAPTTVPDMVSQCKVEESQDATVHVPVHSVQKSWSPSSPKNPAWWPSVSSSSQAEQPTYQCTSVG